MVLTAGSIQKVELAGPIFIGDKSKGFAVFAEIKFIYIPLDIGGKKDGLHRGQVKIGQPLKFRIAVRGAVKTFTILGELSPAVSYFLITDFWRQQLLFPSAHVHQPEVALVGGNRLQSQKLFVVPRPVLNDPPASFQLKQHMVGLRISGIHHPDVSVLTGAPRRTVSEAVVMIGKNPARIARLAVSEQGHLAVSEVIAIVLKPLAATDVFAKNKVIAVRPVMRASCPVGEKGELSPRASRHLHQMDLRDVGKPSRDQHFSPNRIPIQQGSGTK